MGNVRRIKRNSAAAANIFTAVSKTSAAGIRHLVSAYRTFVTGDINHLNHIGIGAITSHSKLHTLCKNRPLLIDTAAHGSFIARNNRLWNIGNMLQQLIPPCQACYLSKHFIFQMLYFRIKFSHSENHPFSMKTLLS